MRQKCALLLMNFVNFLDGLRVIWPFGNAKYCGSSGQVAKGHKITYPEFDQNVCGCEWAIN